MALMVDMNNITMPKLPPTLGEYSILPISMPPLPSFPVKATHCLYVKQHEPKIPTQTDARSLFLINVPIDSTEAHFRAVFNTLIGAGKFEGIVFESEKRSADLSSIVEPAEKKDKNRKRKRPEEGKMTDGKAGQLPKVWDRDLHRSGSTAVAVMVDQKSVEAVLKAARKVHKSGAFPIWGVGVEDKVPKLGSHRYITHHALSYPDEAVLQASVDAFMTEFNKREEAAGLAKRLRSAPDEDGFVTVTRGGRTGPARKEEAEEARRKELEKEEQRRKSMGDFYRFQARERRKEEQGELVKRFEEDRKRVEHMRKERKGRFRPE